MTVKEAKEAIALELEGLSEKQLQDVLQYARSLQQQTSHEENRRSLYGIWKDLDICLKEEDVTEMRQEALASFPREFPQ